ncbi:MAG: hypothetical protein LUG16_07405, partial [Candidatus Gastranaerophilales bacterium]|nr:hypothetical protein [Candidatus Gastranaerophilales bacterium]
LMKSKNKEQETAYMTDGIFSHMKYFSNEKEKISFNIQNSETDKETAVECNSFQDTALKAYLSFSKNIAFLENELGDMTKYEDLEYISALFNKKINKKDLILADFNYPKIECNIQEYHLKNFNLIILWAKVLQINLEYRHYWLLRFLRDLRIYYNYDYKIINNWTFNEYAKQSFKIK